MKFGPKEEAFFANFEELALKIEEAGRLFIELLNDSKYAESKIFRLKELRNEAAAVNHRIKDKMYRTYLAPIDEEDVYGLAGRMNDIISCIAMSAVRIDLYKIKPGEGIIELAETLNDALAKIVLIIPRLKNRKEFPEILSACAEIKKLEGKGDAITHEALKQLFEGEKDAIELIKRKENLERIEDTINLCDDVADIAEGIVIKHG